MNVSDMSDTEKFLGMYWRLSDDTFTYLVNYSRLGKHVIDVS